MTTIFLHIGAPKTATSTLQRVLAKNARMLLKQRVLYPSDIRNGDAHHLIACDLIEKYEGGSLADVWYGNNPRGRAWESLLQEIERHREEVDTVLLSSELFFGQSKIMEPMLGDIRTYLADYDVKVVVYLRRQDQLYSSFYNQDVKGVRHWCGDAYEFYATHQLLRAGYYQLLSQWSAVFGRENVLVRPFEPAQWLNGNVVDDFCQVVGIAPLRSPAKQRNESLGPTQLYIKRCLNRVGFDKGDNEAVLSVLFRLCPEEPAKHCRYVNKEAYRTLRDGWLKDNKLLSRDFTQGEELFHQPIPIGRDLDPYEFSRFGLALFIKNMIREFQRGDSSGYRQLFARAVMIIVAEERLWGAVDAEARAQLLAWV